MRGPAERPRADPADHVAVVAALGRLGRQGGWDRLRAGDPLPGLDHVDAELLAAAGILGRVTPESFSVSVPELAELDASALGHRSAARLRRAVEHLDRTATGWTESDPQLIVAEGRASAVMADVLASEMLPRMPGSRVAMESGSARFLDVGVGVAAISAGLCRRYAGLVCVGLDILDVALELATLELARDGLAGRVELRRQSVVDLPDEDAFDLAWLPQPFIVRADLENALTAVFRALRRDRWVVVPLADTSSEDAFEAATSTHSAEMLGGGAMSLAEGEALLGDAGFVDVLQASWMAQAFLLARAA